MRFYIVALTLITVLLSYYYYLNTNNINKEQQERVYSMAGQTSRQITKSILATEQAEGAGARVRRALGTQRLRNFSPFLMLDHFKVPKGAGFPDHPHRGQSTITYMLKGKFEHEDFKGHRGIIGPGDLQWMQAGKGIVHAEMPVQAKDGDDLPEGLQLWVDLPQKDKFREPDYQDLKGDLIPHAHPEPGVTVEVVSGSSNGSSEEGLVSGPIQAWGGCHYWIVRLEKKGNKFWQDIPKGWASFSYIIQGSAKLGGGDPAKEHTVNVLTSKPDEEGIQIEAESDNVILVLIAGEPLDQPIMQYGPFVLTNAEEVQQAFMDYSEGKNGFEGAHEWQSEIGRSMR